MVGPSEDYTVMRVRATVVSHPGKAWAVLDTGSQGLTHDQYYAKGSRRSVESLDVQITSCSEEHGVVDLAACARQPKAARSSTSLRTTVASSPI